MIEMLVLLLAVALAVNLLGFIRTVWFVSLGYTMSIAVFVVVVLISFRTRISPVALALNIGALAWALRLGIFLLARERKSAYREAVKEQTDASQAQPMLVQAGIWIAVSVLYVCMYSPILLVTTSLPNLPASQLLIPWTGTLILWIGVVLEASADRQKSILKQRSPGEFTHTGLYAWVRYPNYFAEILVWTGALVASIPVLHYAWQWLLVVAGWICIVLIMMGSAKRLEARQADSYRSRAGYAEYTKTVPVLFPWVPIYSLKKLRVYLG